MKTNNQTNHRFMTAQTIRSISSFLTAVSVILLFSCKSQPAEDNPDFLVPGNAITLSDAQVQLANINTAEVRVGSIGRKLTFTGVLKVNEQTAMNVSTWVQGRIEKLYFRNTGEIVKKGDKLYDFYSEDLVTAQREYLRLQSNNWNFSASYEPRLAAEERLLIMGMMPSQIKQLAKDGKVLFTIPIYSPAGGKIRSVNVSEGQFIKEGQILFELADDHNLWVEAQVYPNEVQFLRTGMSAKVTIPSAEDLQMKCNISFINPSFETGKNITLVRAVIDNPGERLHPGMFVILNVITQKSHGIVIPTAAIITTSEGDRVWVREENGEFTYHNVTCGLQSGDSSLVLSGLAESDKIVMTGAYLLNSELILKQGLDMPDERELLSETADNRR